jgi:hypothetical protein
VLTKCVAHLVQQREQWEFGIAVSGHMPRMEAPSDTFLGMSGVNENVGDRRSGEPRRQRPEKFTRPLLAYQAHQR